MVFLYIEGSRGAVIPTVLGDLNGLPSQTVSDLKQQLSQEGEFLGARKEGAVTLQ